MDHGENDIFFHQKAPCPLPRAVLSAVNSMLSALAGGWGRSAPPAPGPDPGAVPARQPPGGATARPTLSHLSRAGPLPTACPSPCGPRQPRHRPGGRGCPESAGRDELTNAAPPAPDFSSQDRMHSLCPPKLELRILVVFALFSPQQCHSRGWDVARLRDRAYKRGIAAPYTTRSRRRRSDASFPGAEVCVSRCGGTI